MKALAGKRRRPYFLGGAAFVIVGGLLIPLGFLVLQASKVGSHQIWILLDDGNTLTLLWNTIRLGFLVTLLSAIIGTGAAWLTERTDLPLRRLWTVLMVLPLVVPDFVIAYGWSSFFPAVHGYYGAVLVMTAGLYPLVYLPMAASFRSADPGQEEVARSLGLSRWRTFVAISIRQARATLLGGCLLVFLAMLAEYGAFEILRYNTFTTAIFDEWTVAFNTSAACALSLVLVVLSVAALGGEALFRERGRTERIGPHVARAVRRYRLGRATPLALLGLLAVGALSLGVPLFVIAYWMFKPGTAGSQLLVNQLATESVLGAAGHSALYSALGALIATVLALPVSLLALRHRSATSVTLERASFIIQALPGLVIALALTYAANNYLDFLYQTPELLVVAYSMIFFPLAVVAVRASVARAPRGLEEIGRALGSGPIRVRIRVTLPLIAPGLAAAFCIVFLSGVTELTATLILVPNGVATLATQFWSYQEGVLYSAAAPYAATMIVMAAIPGYFLSRWFDARSARSTAP